MYICTCIFLLSFFVVLVVLLVPHEHNCLTMHTIMNKQQCWLHSIVNTSKCELIPAVNIIFTDKQWQFLNATVMHDFSNYSTYFFRLLCYSNIMKMVIWIQVFSLKH